MPTPEDQENLQEQEETHAPQPLTFDTRGLDEKIASGVVRGMGEAFRSMMPQQQQVNPELTEQAIDADDDEETRVSKRVHNATIPLKRQMAEFESFGLGKLADLTKDSASRSLPYYNQYRGEIEAELSKLAPVYRADSTVVRTVHDTIVARHIDEIADKRAEEKARQLLQNSEAPGGKGRNAERGADDAPGIPQPKDFFDEEQVRMIEERGGPDAFAKRISAGRFPNWEAYAASRERMANAPRKEGRIVIPLARWQKKQPTA